MARLVGRSADEFVKTPVPDSVLVLVFGPDTGLVRERALAIAARLKRDNRDPFALVQLDGADLERDPARLLDEAQTISLFGSHRVIHIKIGTLTRGGAKNVTSALQHILQHPPAHTTIIIEAGDLKPTSALRKLAEKAERAVALPCYADDRAALSRIIDQALQEFGLSMDNDARALLLSHIGADRLASRGEIEKLCLYAAQKGRITIADVETCVSDAAQLARERLVDAVALGDVATALYESDRLRNAGADCNALAAALLNHFFLLRRLSLEMRTNKISAGQAVRAARPPVFFKRADSITHQISRWKQDNLAFATQAIVARTRNMRTHPDLADAYMERLLMTLAMRR